MNKELLKDLGLTEEDVLRTISERVLDELDVHEMCADTVRHKVNEEVERGLSARIEQTLRAEMERILDKEIIPTNLWGEAEGKPTTIRDQLADRARQFWDESVDEDGKKATYNGKPRHQWCMDEAVRKEFESAIKSNLSDVVNAFKSAVKSDMGAFVESRLNEVVWNDKHKRR